jgi:hypothetical protein
MSTIIESQEFAGELYIKSSDHHRAVAAAVEREREACAYRAGIALLGADRGLASRVDQAIRARKETT